MLSLWNGVQALEGNTLSTSSGRGVFDVVKVEFDRVYIVPRSSGKQRMIHRRDFDKAESLGLATASVTPNQLREAGVSEFNPAYVAALIHAAVRSAPTR